MIKEDILKKVQLEQKDEREDVIITKSFRAGWLGVTIVMVVLLLLRAYFQQSSEDIIIILAAHLSASSFYQYTKMPDKKAYLIFGIINLVFLIIQFYTLLSDFGVF
ncbi:DUF6442 family protein [Facklamia miroungae]|uniref:Uncharacterized protein n=1 Tax=Facklamia miroungae TaxID=120956 RepID=A0A1G7NW66_9LACT|nr:DUF6442 family protein [Facklamia miroungae]NKZ28487.1 hypothetical protein [Facklamia miroungae]SDF78211.1 hypothetical protein SAMN05421791_10126 [Facklamia miroungae]